MSHELQEAISQHEGDTTATLKGSAEIVVDIKILQGLVAESELARLEARLLSETGNAQRAAMLELMLELRKSRAKVEQLESRIQRVKKLEEDKYALWKPYGEQCSKCYTQSQASIISIGSVL